MPFKVVQTYEDGDIFITFCPEQWESGGKLYWPQSMLQGEKLKKKEDSQPGSNWVVLDCEVKRHKLTLAQARAAVKAMSDLSETEEEDERLKAKKRKTRHETKTTCLNELAEQCIANQEKKSSTRNENLKTTQSSHINIVAKEPNLLKRVSPVLENTPTTSFRSEQCLLDTTKSSSTQDELDWKSLLNTKEVMFQLCETDQVKVNAPVKEQSRDIAPPDYAKHTVLSEDINEVENNFVILNQGSSTNDILAEKIDLLFSALVVIQESQKRLENALECVTKMVINTDTKFDEYLKRAHDFQRSANIGMEPIDNKKSLIDFEEKLKNPVMESDLKVKFLVVCGVGKGKGHNNCYSLVDVMFTRRFLTECSWAGGSRDENKSKVCFKSYEKTFNFFFSVIQESDPTFTKVECESFFKNVLKNSNRRNEAKGLRSSSSRVRANKGKGKKSTKSTSDVAKASSSGTTENVRTTDDLTEASSSATNVTIENVRTTTDIAKPSSSNTNEGTENKDKHCEDQNK